MRKLFPILGFSALGLAVAAVLAARHVSSPVPFDEARWPRTRDGGALRYRMSESMLTTALRDGWDLPTTLAKLGPPDYPEHEIVPAPRRRDSQRIIYTCTDPVIRQNHYNIRIDFDERDRLVSAKRSME